MIGDAEQSATPGRDLRFVDSSRPVTSDHDPIFQVESSTYCLSRNIDLVHSGSVNLTIDRHSCVGLILQYNTFS